MIAAIEGHTGAGGLELALWCDLRVAGRDAVLGLSSRRFGELRHGLETIAGEETLKGAEQFRRGAGRHVSFVSSG